MIDVTLRINGVNFSQKLSTYSIENAVETVDTVTTFDGTEHSATRTRAIVTFSLIPLTDAETNAFFTALSRSPAEVVYTNPAYVGNVVTTMNVASSLNSAFALRSIDGNRYYKGGEITLREKYAR